MDIGMEKQLHMNCKNFLQISHVMIFHRKGEHAGKIFNKTYAAHKKTSHEDISATPEMAYFSKDGEDMNDPDWDKIEENNSNVSL